MDPRRVSLGLGETQLKFSGKFSLIADLRSLLCEMKIPVKAAREFFKKYPQKQRLVRGLIFSGTKNQKIPCIFPVKQGKRAETGLLQTASTKKKEYDDD